VEQFRSREFAGLSAEEFATLLDEMQGLGVFRRDAEQRYSLRNANVLLLLGDKDSIENELIADRQVAKPEYRSESFHGPLRGAKKIEHGRRRVFTRPEEGRLLGRTGACVVIGSSMLGSELLEASLKAVTDEVTRTAAQRLEDFLASLKRIRVGQADGTYVVLVPETVQWEDSWVARAHEWCSQLRSEGKVLSVVFQASSEHIWNEGRLRGFPTDVPCLSIRKWTADFIHPWLAEENRPVPPDGGAQLAELTGGWPRLVYRFARSFISGATFSTELEKTRAGIEDWIAGSDAGKEFVGGGSDAERCLAELRLLRDLAPANQPSFSNLDLEDAAGLLGISAQRILFLVTRAEQLRLVDRSGPGIFEWDPVFNRFLTRT
jgi:hypothetical protein